MLPASEIMNTYRPGTSCETRPGAMFGKYKVTETRFLSSKSSVYWERQMFKYAHVDPGKNFWSLTEKASQRRWCFSWAWEWKNWMAQCRNESSLKIHGLWENLWEQSTCGEEDHQGSSPMNEESGRLFIGKDELSNYPKVVFAAQPQQSLTF